MTDALIQPILRGWTTSTKPVDPEEPATRFRHRPRDEEFVCFDTETTSDAIQTLRFGAFVYGMRRKDGEIEIIERGLFIVDEPITEDENAAEVMAAYADSNGVLFMNTQQFCERYLWKYGVKKQATIVGFNLPFDISRIAVRVTESRKQDDGFSFRIFRDVAGKEYGIRPPVHIKKLGAKKQSIGWGTYIDPDSKGKPQKFPGRNFIDVHQAVAAHNGGASFTLGQCAELYHTRHQKSTADYDGAVTAEYLDYCLNDVMVTVEVYQGVYRQHLDRKSGTKLSNIYSTASLSKGLMDDLGVIPPLVMNPDFPRDALGLSMASFIGARTESHVVNGPVPGRLLDFTSMYPTVGSLMGLTRFLRCERIRVEDATEDVSRLLEGMTLDRCFDKSAWPLFCGVAIVAPGQTITVPVRADYGGGGTQVSVSRFTPSEPFPFAIPDLVAACILDGKVPEIVKAIRLVPEGTSPFLRKAKLPGGLSLDIRKQDLFRTLVEQRNNYKKAHCQGHGSEPECIKNTQCEHCSVSLYLKILVNALYGIFAEMNPVKARNKEQTYTQTVGRFTTVPHTESWSVWAHGKPVHKLKLDKPEEPGRFCFPPLAMLFTSGARLMLAMLERRVTDLGGTYAMMDTDSMFLISSAERESIKVGDGEIQTLSYGEVETVADSFQKLSPYSEGIRLLKREYPKDESDEGWCIAISSKRYALFGKTLDSLEITDGASEDEYFRIDKPSEHGLGYLKNPAKGWRNEAWKWVIANKVRDRLDRENIDRPAWFDLPAIGQHSVTTPWLLDAFKVFNEGKPYQQQIRPFNFMSVAYQSQDLRRSGAQRLVSPLISDVRDAIGAPWFDIYSGEPRTITTEITEDDSRDIQIDKYSHVMHKYLIHAELKAAGMDGHQATGRTVGQLGRLNLIQAATARVQGKEYNEQDEQAVHLKTEDETTLVYVWGTDTIGDVRLILESAGLDPNRSDGKRIAILKAVNILRKYKLVAGSSEIRLKVAAAIIRENGPQDV